MTMINRNVRKLLFAFCSFYASAERPHDSRDSHRLRHLKKRRPTGGLSSILHRREKSVTANAGSNASEERAIADRRDGLHHSQAKREGSPTDKSIHALQASFRPHSGPMRRRMRNPGILSAAYSPHRPWAFLRVVLRYWRSHRFRVPACANHPARGEFHQFSDHCKYIHFAVYTHNTEIRAKGSSSNSWLAGVRGIRRPTMGDTGRFSVMPKSGSPEPEKGSHGCR